MLYPNKNVQIILKNDHLWSFFNIIYTFLGSIFELCCIPNSVIMNHVIQRLKYIQVQDKSSDHADMARKIMSMCIIRKDCLSLHSYSNCNTIFILSI